MKTTWHCRIIAPVILLSLVCTSAFGFTGTSAAVDTLGHVGLAFDVQAASHLSSLDAYRDAGYAVSLGFGVRVPPHFLFTVNVYTGSSMVPHTETRPVHGSLAVGGAALEATYLPTTGTALRPYVAGGVGLYTYLTEAEGGIGYNGGGYYFEMGLQWDFSVCFSVRGGLQYGEIFFHNPVGDAAELPGFEPFTSRQVGAAIRCAFYPDILP